MAILSVLLLGPLPAHAQTDGAGENAAVSAGEQTYEDRQLVALLASTGLTAEWLDATDVSRAAAMVEVTGGSGYLDSRAAFIDELNKLTERRVLIQQRLDDIDRITADTAKLEQLILALRHSLAANGQSPATSLTGGEVVALRLDLAAIAGSRRWMGVSLEPTALAEHHLVTVRDEIVKVVDGLSRVADQRSKSADAEIFRLTQLHTDLQQVRVLVDRSKQSSVRSQLAAAAHRAAVVELMPDLHTRRLLSPSVAGGLPVVSLDAYVRGAEVLDPNCPVEWNLIAGIGRVESRHGTIGDSTVQASGRVTVPILGPLLDGGATEREAAEAAAQAEEAALAEAEAAAAAQEEATDPAFDATVWGAETLDRAEELREDAAPADAVGLAAPPVEVVDEPDPRYDPLLWGDDLPFDEDDLPPLDEGEIDGDGDEDEEPEFKGNGFAVIEDSDDGALDGNDRWDRAVGPMQFIPETWSHWATDGNGDGVTDPQNLYDAAASAGQFLCHLSRTRGSSPYSFVLGYNSSNTYVRNVMAVADAFGAAALPE